LKTEVTVGRIGAKQIRMKFDSDEGNLMFSDDADFEEIGPEPEVLAEELDT